MVGRSRRLRSMANTGPAKPSGMRRSSSNRACCCNRCDAISSPKVTRGGSFENLWPLLQMEVRHWRRQGQLSLLWWRDDDARHATPALERLLEIAGHHVVPITLAVIPAGSLGGLAEILSRLPGVIVAQHGVTHSNARRPGEPPDEFPADVATDAVAVAMSAGADRLVSLPRRIALYVPPWNRVTPALGSALRL